MKSLRSTDLNNNDLEKRRGATRTLHKKERKRCISLPAASSPCEFSEPEMQPHISHWARQPRRPAPLFPLRPWRRGPATPSSPAAGMTADDPWDTPRQPALGGTRFGEALLRTYLQGRGRDSNARRIRLARRGATKTPANSFTYVPLGPGFASVKLLKVHSYLGKSITTCLSR